MSSNILDSNNITDLKKYLFEDVFKYFKDQNFENERYRYISKKGVLTNSFNNFFFKIVISIFHFIEFNRMKFQKNQKTIFFYADPLTYSDIVNYLHKQTTLLVNNPKRFPGKLKDNISKNLFFVPLFLISRDLVDGYEKKQDFLIDRAFKSLYNIIKRTNCNIIVINDSIYPINRALILVAKQLNIVTIEIQHAVYPSELNLISGIGSDYVFVWGNFFKDMYLKQLNKHPNSIKVLGYPFNLPNDEIINNSNKLTVYYLAQGFQYEDINNLDILLHNALELKSICEEFNMIFKCRLHPNSPKILLDKILPKIECTPKNETLQDALFMGDIFISFNSTALIQAALLGKNCIQLKNIPVITDDFEALGICEKTFSSLVDLKSHLLTLSYLSKYDLRKNNVQLNENYVLSNKNSVGEHFLDLINEIHNE